MLLVVACSQMKDTIFKMQIGSILKLKNTKGNRHELTHPEDVVVYNRCGLVGAVDSPCH